MTDKDQIIREQEKLIKLYEAQIKRQSAQFNELMQLHSDLIDKVMGRK